MILSGNSIEHGLLALAAMYAGIPYAPIAPAYSLAVKEFTALSYGVAELRSGHGVSRTKVPGSLRVEGSHAGRDGNCLSQVLVRRECVPSHWRNWKTLSHPRQWTKANWRTGPTQSRKFCTPPVRRACPRGVITTHRMLCSNQQMLQQMMQSLADEPPVLCDWLPWNHTFGGSHNFGNWRLYNGGSLYIDAGKPTPDLFWRDAAQPA